MANINISQAKQRAAGFNCPVCSFFIEVSIESLLHVKHETCPKCQTEFTMNRHDSDAALQFLQKLKMAEDNLKSIK